MYMLWFLLDAWNCWIPCSFALCPPHISIHQVRVGNLSSQVTIPLELLSSFHRHSVENYSNFGVLLCTIRGSWVGWVSSFRGNLLDHKGCFWGERLYHHLFNQTLAIPFFSCIFELLLHVNFLAVLKLLSLTNYGEPKLKYS